MIRLIFDSNCVSIDDFEQEIRQFMGNDHFIAKAVYNVWDGVLIEPKKVNCFDDLAELLQGYDRIVAYDDKGHLYIKCYHHDGVNQLELYKRLSSGNLTLPHYANVMYGEV